jgi:hypothetical protein
MSRLGGKIICYTIKACHESLNSQKNTVLCRSLLFDSLMNQRQFITTLVATVAIVVALQVIFQQFSRIFQAHAGVTWWSLAFFTPLSIGMYIAGKRAAVSSNKGLFTGLTMALTFIKIMVGVICMVVYRKVFGAQGKDFLLPFFVVYFAFTIFETFFMIKLAKEN